VHRALVGWLVCQLKLDALHRIARKHIVLPKLHSLQMYTKSPKNTNATSSALVFRDRIKSVLFIIYYLSTQAAPQSAVLQWRRGASKAIAEEEGCGSWLRQQQAAK
jgi:hypothetical protein